MKLTFHGAAHDVTGSRHLLTVNGKNILLDCGLYQGKRADAIARNTKFPFDPKSINAIVLSHAHIDHSGNLPGIVKQGYAGPIYCTEATADLCGIMLADSGHIQEKDIEFLNKKNARKHLPLLEPLYTAKDAEHAVQFMKKIPYHKPFDVIPGVTVEFFDAGHILGSACIKLTIKENGKTTIVGFTGDLGRPNMPILRDPEPMGDVDILLSESTYGGKTTPPPGDMERELGNDLAKTIARGGKIIVPAFSVGRTQDLVYALHNMQDAGTLPKIPVYVDSPLAVNATDIYKRHQECFDEDTWKHINAHHDPFGFNKLTYVRTVEESKAINDLKGSLMIISASGMCEGGRILHHLANNIGDERNTILIVGYQAESTLGRRLVEEAPEVKIYGDIYKRKAEVIVHNGFSAHADGNELRKYIGQFDKKRLKRIFLVHGEVDRSMALKADLTTDGFSQVDAPAPGDSVEF
ncbi:MAG TPA: MBL fold metallo-hydrolase [Bacteroidota bacterium]|nr:MBL fold metallo-hydrolase [Bacteroidota bacterium]